MDFNEYQNISNSTSSYKDKQEIERTIVAVLGLTGESGEVADHLKKAIGHGHVLHIDHVVKELGDIMWYVAEVASSLGLQLDDIASRNVEKLAKRYPDGFSSERSINRNDV